ncbi:Nitric oxide dioxygenase [Purpureocillium takamizusanense]|uniref:nitric oxide dioxygenase n=1 Tax=Purpureocillium takamizusanense TaxID=2060973 RepID=A0A9Q8QGG7_9HYPO|nr:Nitric oxide dioxygenase [Purpureocillium takamizusanense]UNI18421.1 Nitric oxide dioxygenase [Purpureocillium takamizusanense]
MALTAEQIAIVKSTAPVVKQHGRTITTTFYESMLSAHPELHNIFSVRNQHTGAQQTALANAVFAYAAHIDNLGALGAAVERIAHKHTALFVKPEQYAIVGEHLVGAFATVLGDALTDEVKEAWVAAYGQLADVFIQREKQMYEASGDEWQSWRKFVVARRVAESDDVVSLYLRPRDGTPLRSFKAGQYVSVQVPVAELGGVLQSRQFSISSVPGEGLGELRVSVKRERLPDGAAARDMAVGKVPGLVSNKLHDDYLEGSEVELSAPHGDFYWDANEVRAGAPVVLLSVGVGATPVIAILQTMLRDGERRPISYIHGARHARSVLFREELKAAMAKHDNVRRAVVVKTVTGMDRVGQEYDMEGRMDLAKVGEELHLDHPDAQYYFCGPEGWMLETHAWLVERGVAPERLHMELFRTGTL